MSVEADLQRQVVELLTLLGNMVFRLNSGYSGRRNVKLLPPGTPDLLVVCPKGRVVWVELKTSTGKLRESQLEMHERLRGLGHEVLLVRDLNDLSSLQSP